MKLVTALSLFVGIITAWCVAMAALAAVLPVVLIRP